MCTLDRSGLAPKKILQMRAHWLGDFRSQRVTPTAARKYGLTFGRVSLGLSRRSDGDKAECDETNSRQHDPLQPNPCEA
jgi:hypothetical protein